MFKHLVIVESPTKAKTISKFLGSEYRVVSSFGHIRDLPKKEMGVDIEHDFFPSYIVPEANKKRVEELKKLAKQAQDVYYATDEDREGEAIAWHLHEILKTPPEKTFRIAFHEITEEAIRASLVHPRKIDIHLVDAQQARRVLDRLVGYELSPFLWRKVAKGLSAGRVQSVAVRLIVEREREIQAFVVQDYWTIGFLGNITGKPDATLTAQLNAKNGKNLDKFEIGNQEQAEAIVAQLKGASYTVADMQQKESRKKAPAPYITSTLQQDANRRLRMSTKQAMMFAQQLYEGIEADKAAGGYITYMRTDSMNLSQKFLGEAQEYLSKELGTAYATGSRTSTKKAKGAQEAHEAIRPTSIFRTPESVRGFLSDQQFKLYDLIWRRALASQMPDALYEATTIDIAAPIADGEYTFRATGQVERFDGFTKIYGTDSEDVILPAVQKGDSIDCQELTPEEHSTKPPARYSEAGLVKALEERGIGRPSTYAPTISTVIDRGYVTREERRLRPTDMAMVVTDVLVKHFPTIADYDFTASLEQKFDDIAEGEKAWVPVIKEFYTPFKETLTEKDKTLKKDDLTTEATDEVCEKCGKPMIIKVGRFGRFLACTGYPECKNTKPLAVSIEEHSEEEGAVAQHDPCEVCGSPMVVKHGRFGAFLACSKYPECKHIRSLSDRKTGITCPECNKGEIIQKKSKRGKIFFSCNKYPDCKYISWIKPGEEGATPPGEEARAAMKPRKEAAKKTVVKKPAAKKATKTTKKKAPKKEEE